MDIEKMKDMMACRDGLSNTLGMEFLSTPEPDTCMARMKVTDKNKQIFGFLSGGATLALAENLAGVGSMALCPDNICVGINVSGNHVRTVMEGETVTAFGRLQHQGATLHQWHIEIKNAQEELISTVQVINYVMNKPKND